MRRALLVGVVLTLASCSDAAPAGASGSGSGTSGGATDQDAGVAAHDGSAAEICVASINEYRKKKNLPAYARWESAETCSDGQAASDGASNGAHAAFGKCGEHAQNECPGWPGPPGTMIPKCLAAMVAEGPGGGHHDAIMGNYTKVACGFGTAHDGQIWAVQNFQ